jgi:hypothetical protein
MKKMVGVDEKIREIQHGLRGENKRDCQGGKVCDC